MPEELPPPRRRLSHGRKWLVALLVLLVLIVGLFFGGKAWLQNYIAGPKFLKQLGGKAAGLIDAPAGFTPLTWSETSAFSEGFLSKGSANQSLKELRARQLTAVFDWQQLVHRQITIPEITIHQLQCALSQLTLPELEQDLAALPALEPPNKKKSIFSIDLRQVVVDRATMLWGEAPEEHGAFREVALRFWPMGKNLAIYGQGGTFQVGALPVAGVLPFQLRYEKPRLTIEWGSLTLQGSSEIKVTGVFEFTDPGLMDLRFSFRECPAEPFLKPDIRAKFDGTFRTDMRMQKPLKGEKPATYSGPAQFSGATFKNIPALAKLAAFTQEPRFQKLKLQTLKGSYTYTEPTLQVTDLVAEAEDLFQVEGGVTIEDKQIRGTVQLGATAKVLESFPGAREEVFTKHRQGYYWTTVKLSGTTEKPEEDLKERLVDAAKKHVVEKALTPVTKPLDFLKRSTGTVLEKLKELF